MQFGEYIKGCRERYDLTQEDLVAELYHYDIREFGGLDVTTLSKWERGRSQPPPLRIAAILKYFQERSGLALPCVENHDLDSAETILSQEGINTLIGKTRALYVQLPLDSLPTKEYRLIPLRHFERREQILEVHQALYDSVNTGFARVELDKFREWSLDPRHLFHVLLYKDVILGLLFALRMKPESFEEVLRFERSKSQIDTEDFAELDAPSSLYILSSFALHPRFLSTLYLKLAAHLIVHQQTIEQVGLVTPLPEVERMADRMNLRHRAVWQEDDQEIHAYASTVKEMLRGEEVVRALFPRRSD
jgi:transcriptional regulator with XRE-family HTH domain